MKKIQIKGATYKLHNHPKMERSCRIEKDHVIIDRDIFEALHYQNIKSIVFEEQA